MKNEMQILKVENPILELESLFGFLNEYTLREKGLPVPSIDPRKSNCWYYNSAASLEDQSNDIQRVMFELGFSAHENETNAYYKAFYWYGVQTILRVYVDCDGGDAFHIALYPFMLNSGYIQPLGFETKDHTTIDEEDYSFAFELEPDDYELFNFKLDEANKKKVLNSLIAAFMEV